MSATAASAGAATSAPATPSTATPPAAGPARRLELGPCDPVAVEALRGALGCSRTLAQVLVRRGYGDPAAARAFLAADEHHPPSAFAGIERAVDLILGHVRAGTRITVHGDYDVDGVCATAVLLRALRRHGADVEWFLPSRIDDGYGLAGTTVDRLAERGTRLLITVDCAITAVEEVARARAAGIDVVVTDHHQVRADGALPDAPIVHPALCGYPCPDLCAAAVAYKLAQAVDAAAGVDPAQADADLDLVALATVADLVPLRGENRRLVRAGLRALASTDKPGLRALMRVARVDPSGLDAGAVAFRLAPRINAAGRLHRADAAVELLLTTDAARATAVADELDAMNAERRAIERRILWEAEAQVAELGERPAYVLAAEGWHPGVIGIVASTVVERTHRPTLLVSLDPETGIGTGSGRSIPAFDLLGALHAAAPLLDRYGGHRAAAGVTVAAGRVPALREALERHAAATLAPDDLIPVERVDAVVGGGALGLELADELTRLEPCGIGNPGVNLLVPGAALVDVRPMGEDGRHARFTVEAGGARCRAVAFGCDGRLPVDEGTPADVVVRLERNEWNGAVEARVRLRHAAPAAPAPIAVVGEPEPERWLATVLEELDRLRAPGDAPDVALAAAAPAVAAGAATVIDRRGESGSAILAELVAGGANVLALCADVPRRHGGLAARVGGFALCSHAGLARAPHVARDADHVVVLDPPAHPSEHARMLAVAPRAVAHLAWGPAELRFAQQIDEREYSLRASLVPLYRVVRDRGTVAGEELERLLRGDGPHGRSAWLAARLVGVLEELGLVRLDRERPALSVVSAERTELDRSAIHRAAQARFEDGQRFLRTTATKRSDAATA